MNGTKLQAKIKHLRKLVRATENKPIRFEPIYSKPKGPKLPACYVCGAYVSKNIVQSGIDNYCGCRGWD